MERGSCWFAVVGGGPRKEERTLDGTYVEIVLEMTDDWEKLLTKWGLGQLSPNRSRSSELGRDDEEKYSGCRSSGSSTEEVCKSQWQWWKQQRSGCVKLVLGLLRRNCCIPSKFPDSKINVVYNRSLGQKVKNDLKKNYFIKFVWFQKTCTIDKHTLAALPMDILNQSETPEWTYWRQVLETA